MKTQNRKVYELILCDKSLLVLKGLTALLEGYEDFVIKKQFTLGKEFVEYVQSSSCDVAIVGWEFPDWGGRRILREVNERGCSARILIYSSRQVSYTSMQLGASGYLSKLDNPEILPDMLRLIAKGKSCFPYLDFNKKNEFKDLTHREFQLLELISTGMSNRLIASEMGISENTVKFHLKNLFLKMGVGNRTEAASTFREKIL